MDKAIEILMEKYGYFEDVELGRIPVLHSDMTKEENELADMYIKIKVESIGRVEIIGE